MDESRFTDLRYNVECHIKVPDLPAHPGRLLCLDVSDGGEGGAAGGVQGEAGHNLSNLLLLLDAGSGSLKSMHIAQWFTVVPKAIGSSRVSGMRQTMSVGFVEIYPEILIIKRNMHISILM